MTGSTPPTPPIDPQPPIQDGDAGEPRRPALSQFKPIEKLAIPGIDDFEPSGLIVVVGPNLSGKTQLLRDLHDSLSGRARELVVSEIRIGKPTDFDTFLDCLVQEGYMAEVEDDTGRKQYRPLVPRIGYDQAGPIVATNQATSWWTAYSPVTSKRRLASEFLDHFGQLLVTALFLDNRLTTTSEVGNFDHETQPPGGIIQALYLNRNAKDALTAEIERTFGRSIWVDNTKANVLCLRIHEGAERPPAEERLEPLLASKYRTMEREGDGLKSYVATCMAILLGLRPVLLIDEPEICLHPPQAHRLGRFIGTHGTADDKATFIATHSSQLLRGIIQTASKVAIIRLTRDQRGFSGHLVPSDILETALNRPRVRGETILDGIFADAVVIVEADGDRLVYQAAWESLSQETNVDLHLAPVGGAGGISETYQLYRTLRIPVAVIADLDVLADDERLKQILGFLTDHQNAQIRNDVRAVINEVLGVPPARTAQAVSDKLRAFADLELDWDQSDDVGLKKRLRALSNDIDRVRRLKRGGVAQFQDQIKSDLLDVIETCKAVGLFLVPVGELEYWLQGHNVQASRQKKWAWANEAADLIRNTRPQGDDIWEFMRSIDSYLKTEP